ncbi:hypothetical protein BI364_12955 [Acidihalobacter yilgarnensis]|uniref:DUF3579 domain-containing protein n=1 Tax=Acidihalobacter yilgarnensis TaxID=2819280 RepID=A0A1D8IQL1_9GAMM|nr:DUF3579 domain-containing protein [Acidihalobacter yilgarnensis]AOU98752.1 hypothetical protein BI364_12955 [Acidihalobacter yilgarnensis]
MNDDAPFHGEAIISGYRAGTKFRPSAWPEMLCAAAAAYDARDRRLAYADYLRPVYTEKYGHCVEVDFEALKQASPGSYQLVLDFVKSNALELYTHHDVAIDYTTPHSPDQAAS